MTLVAPLHGPLLCTLSVNVSEGVPEQLAPLMLAEGTPVLEGEISDPGQPTIAYGQVNEGGVSHTLHVTVTVNETCAELPQLSVAVYITVVVP